MTAGVYILQADSGLVKIGLAQNIERRVLDIQAMSPSALTLVHVIETDRAREVERLLHIEFKARREWGEWFRLSPFDLERVKTFHPALPAEPRRRVYPQGPLLVLTKLKEIRERKGLSQRDLSDRSGVAQATISHLEQGRPARFVTMRALAKALEVETEMLVDAERRTSRPAGGEE